MSNKVKKSSKNIFILKNGTYARKLKNGQFRFIKNPNIPNIQKYNKKNKQVGGAKKNKIGEGCKVDKDCYTSCCKNDKCVSSIECKPKSTAKKLPPILKALPKKPDILDRSMSTDTTYSKREWGPCKYGNTCLRYRSKKGCRYEHPETIDECLNMHDEYKKICPSENPKPGDLLFYESGIIDKDGNKLLCSEISDKELKKTISDKYKTCSKARSEWYNKCEQQHNIDKRRRHKITVLSMARRSKDCID